MDLQVRGPTPRTRQVIRLEHHPIAIGAEGRRERTHPVGEPHRSRHDATGVESVQIAQEQIGGLTALLVETFGAARFVKTYGLEDRETERARDGFEQRRKIAMRLAHNRAYTVPLLEIQLRQAENLLCILLGIPPENLRAKLGDGSIPTAPVEVAIGIPADLLTRRPDVRRAEREAAAQSARIGVAA